MIKSCAGECNNKIMKSKFCISSTAPFERINKAQTNHSATKQTFSFSKGSRFQEAKPTCPLNTYGGQIIAKKTGTCLGYGSRSDFTKCLATSPSSNQYRLATFWDENIKNKKGAGFALSREQVAFNSYIPKEQLTVPAASHYKNDKILSSSAPKYSLRQKTSMADKQMTLGPQNKNPGPGSYLNPEMQSKPSFNSISKFQSLSYGQTKSKRFHSSETVAPGPGKYQQIRALPKTGSYVLSQNKGGTKAKFDGEKRESVFERIFKKELANPGPGYYQAPSEFGLYDGNIYEDLRKGKRSANGWTNLTQRKNKK